MVAVAYVPAVTAVATRSICGVEPPLELMRPDVPITLDTAAAAEIAVHALPLHAYIVDVVEFQYVAPVIRALPKLSTDGADDLLPR